MRLRQDHESKGETQRWDVVRFLNVPLNVVVVYGPHVVQLVGREREVFWSKFSAVVEAGDWSRNLYTCR